ncbi:hypothetical protein ABH966_001338 [Lysinibacillus sp. RC46]|uniref:hypothetical protein n=1 Tax=unclassified Lysinibacillus TaxID=2636778 RepID=UPI0035146246
MKKKNLGQSSDITFSWVTEIDPKLEQWGSLAKDYLITVIRNKSGVISALGKFLIEYLHKKNISKVPLNECVLLPLLACSKLFRDNKVV